MQRRLTKKLSDTLQQREEDDYPHRHQFPIPQIPQYGRPPPQPPGAPYGYRPQQSAPVDIPNPYYQQIPIRNPSSGTRLAATLNNQPLRPPQQYYESLPIQAPAVMPWNPPNYGPDNGPVSRSSSADDLSDDVSLDEYIPEEPQRSYYSDDNSTSYDRGRDRDRDYSRSRSSTVPPARISSRDHVQERDEPPIKLKGKKSSKSFLPSKKLSKSKSITVKDSNTYTSSSGSGSSRSESGRTSRGSHSDTSRPQSRSSSRISLSGNHRDQSPRKHSSTRVPGGHSPSRRGSSSSSSSREVMALPIEIPESVTDADAFRRYLSVRRGGIHLAGISTTSSFEALDDDDYQVPRPRWPRV